MSRALVLTVGTGTRADSDIAQALKRMIQNSNPDRVIFLVSAESAQHAARIRAELGLGDDVARDAPVDHPDDVEHAFLRALDAFRALRADGFAPEAIDADYTSGTKAMTAGLALAAVAFRCGTLKYITGRRDLGVVVAGSERFLAIQPAGILAHHEVQLALRLCRALQFEAVRQVLPGSEARLLSDHDARVLAGLRALAEAYDAWDKFQHRDFNRPYRQVDFSLPELAPFQLAGDIPERVQSMHRAREQKDWRKKIAEDHLADLWNNAWRRQWEGKYDDAVARLYRLTEMVAQYALARAHGVDTADVRPEELSVPPELRDRLERQRRRDQRDKVKTGLQDDYELLQALGSPLGAAFQKRSRLQTLLHARNGSILAHGVQPVGREHTAELAGEVAALAEIAVPAFGQRCAALQFPWLAQDGKTMAAAE